MMLHRQGQGDRTIMGYSITWCAVRDQAAQALLQRLALSATGKLEEVPESPISMARLDTGWRIVWYNGYECPFLRAQDLHDLSKDEDVLLCHVEEHVMASSCEMWSHGARSWWVSHEGEEGPKGLSIEGALPKFFPRIRREMEEAQHAAGGDDADVDYIFEIPLKLAAQLVGFKHDEDYAHVVGGHFAVLSRDGSNEPRSILRRLFGK